MGKSSLESVLDKVAEYLFPVERWNPEGIQTADISYISIIPDKLSRELGGKPESLDIYWKGIFLIAKARPTELFRYDMAQYGLMDKEIPDAERALNLIERSFYT
jgi:hypothetical protein